MRSTSSLALALLLLVAVAAPSRAQQADPTAPRRQALAEARALVQRLRQPGQRALTAGQLTRVRGLLVGEHAALFDRGATASAATPPAGKQESREATFHNTHPMFRRLAASGWFRQTARVEKLQALADNLRATRALPPTTPLAQVELLVFDLEASGGAAGRFDAKKQRLFFGWDEITQFGYTVYRGGAAVETGAIKVRPDVAIAPIVQQITGFSASSLAGAARFEGVAEQILTLMQGRVLVGHGSSKSDWSWLQSNLARLGVDLPGPRSLLLDTYLLSFHSYPAGAALKALAERYRVDRGQAHDAGSDARTTGGVLASMLRERNVSTLGAAFRLQDEGRALMHRPRPAPTASVEPAAATR